MALLGKAAVVIWCEVAPGMLAEHDAWHSSEHLPERMGVPGFRRGRRAAALGPNARQARFVLYEIDDLSVATSAPYLERLNDPTPWSRKVMAECRLSRTLCRVAATHGTEIGRFMLAVRLAPRADRAEALQQWLGATLAELPGSPGVVAAHLLQKDAGTVRPFTEEERIRRGSADEAVDWVVLVEGNDEPALQRLADGPLSPASLGAHGAAQGTGHAVYALSQVATPG